MAKETTRLDDFPILKELLNQDTGFKRHYRQEGGFVVTDFTILDDVLTNMNRKLLELETPGRVIFVEFARDKYSTAIENFDRDVLKKSLLLYIYCPFDVCVKRNVRRFKEAGGKNLDDHIAPTDIMEKYYKNDDYEEAYLRSEGALKLRLPTSLVVVRNDVDSLEHLGNEIDKVMEFLKE
jgi:hypothetical protein